jgi:lycopene beta-cyclase
MQAGRYDIAIAGAGLAGGLIALALRQARPELSVLLVEQGAAPGGAHGWHWLEHDLPDGGAALLAPLRKTSWDSGHEVRFPGHRRRFASAFHHLSADDFAAALRRELAPGSIRCYARIAALDSGGIVLEGGTRIAARSVIDCRGFAPTPLLSGAWHHALARRLRTPQPHGVDRALLIDATVPQDGALRYASVIPLGLDELLVADHALLPSAQLDRRIASRRIDAYCGARGWQGELLGHEAGVRPVVTRGDFAAWHADLSQPGVALAGTRAGLFHPFTGQGLGAAVGIALLVAAEADLPGEQLAALLAGEARRHWNATAACRRLAGLVLAGGAGLAAWERLYRQPSGLVRRFEAGRPGRGDRLRLACAAPGAMLRPRLASGAPLADSAGS